MKTKLIGVKYYVNTLNNKGIKEILKCLKFEIVAGNFGVTYFLECTRSNSFSQAVQHFRGNVVSQGVPIHRFL